MRCSLIWLPFWRRTEKPNCSKIRTTSAPESVFNFFFLDIRQFVLDEDGWRGSDAGFCRILVFKIQLNNLANVFIQLLERLCLRDDRNADALGGVPFSFLRDIELDDLTHTDIVPKRKKRASYCKTISRVSNFSIASHVHGSEYVQAPSLRPACRQAGLAESITFKLFGPFVKSNPL